MMTLAGILSVVPLETANLLAYVMMALIAFFLIFGPAVAYYLWKQNRKKVVEATDPPTETA